LKDVVFLFLKLSQQPVITVLTPVKFDQLLLSIFLKAAYSVSEFKMTDSMIDVWCRSRCDLPLIAEPMANACLLPSGSFIAVRAALRIRLVRIRHIPGPDGDKRGIQTETRAGEFIVATSGEGIFNSSR
jgi:hypothetical protein